MLFRSALSTIGRAFVKGTIPRTIMNLKELKRLTINEFKEVVKLSMPIELHKPKILMPEVPRFEAKATKTKGIIRK